MYDLNVLGYVFASRPNYDLYGEGERPDPGPKESTVHIGASRVSRAQEDVSTPSP